MKAPKKMQKPENWQDFELLCKKLWGEIWKCDEIKKNGRQGQAQNGVDVYGIPKGKEKYYGIQCKGKDDYINSALTKKEINEEIEKAKKFKPKLEKFYFATTGNKDVSIEEYVREKNLENKEDFFEVHIFMWEDIVDLINENPNTHRFYVESINYKDENSADLVFSNGTNVFKEKVYFSNKTYKYVYKEPVSLPFSQKHQAIAEVMKNISISHGVFGGGEYKGENLSWGEVELILKNKGNKQLENYKIYLQFTGNIEVLDEKTGINYIALKPENRDAFIDNDTKTGVLKPIGNKPLVPKDVYNFRNIDFKPKKEVGVMYIDWEIVSSHYNKKGRLEVYIEIEYVNEEETIYVENKNEVREETIIENFYYKEEDSESSE